MELIYESEDLAEMVVYQNLLYEALLMLEPALRINVDNFHDLLWEGMYQIRKKHLVPDEESLREEEGGE